MARTLGYFGNVTDGPASFHEQPAGVFLIIVCLTVAVGTTIAGRLPHRSVRARLRIRLLPRMTGVEALIGIGVLNAGLRNPPVQQWVETVPTHLRALTATAKTLRHNRHMRRLKTRN